MLSFVEMTKYLLSQPDSKGLFLLSERITQDAVENYFGKQQARGGRCDNPTIKDCLARAVAIHAQQSLELDWVRGNCRRKRLLEDTNEPTCILDSTPLPNRKDINQKKKLNHVSCMFFIMTTHFYSHLMQFSSIINTNLFPN